MTTLPTRQQIDRAAPLDFEGRAAQAERQCNITVELAPDGVHVKAEYTGGLSSIPAVIERLKALGVVELVGNSANRGKLKAETVEPLYQPDGTPCCPVHLKPLSEGRYGLFCSAKAKPGDVQNQKGYCALRFSE
jgi:hypothetical protein